MSNKLFCSFCGRANHEVDQLIAGPAVYICNECVDDCAAIISAKRLGQLPGGGNTPAAAFLAGAHPGFSEAVRQIVQQEFDRRDGKSGTEPARFFDLPQEGEDNAR